MKLPLVHRSCLLATAVILATTQFAGAASFFWSQATPGANNWNVNANWTPSTGNPGVGDTAVFGLTGTVADSLTVNNVVSVNTTISTLQFTNTGAGIWHVTEIPSSVTLTVATNMTVGGITYGAGTGAPALAAMTGGGTLAVTGNALLVGQGTSANQIAGNTLDLSGLSNFVYSASGGTITMGNGNRSAANVNLAAVSNSVTAATWNANTGSSSSATTGTLTLGAGTNVINVNTFNAALNRNSCTVTFPATGGLRLRGAGGTDTNRVNMTLGNHSATGTGSTAAGRLAFNGHPVDMKLGTLTLGQSGANTTGGSNPGNGTVEFDTGVVDVTTVNMAIASNTSFNSANGTITVGAGGTLIVGAGGISMANLSGAASAANGTITVTGGTLTCATNIVKTTTAGTATISLDSGAKLTLTSPSATIGTAAAPIDNFNISDSTLTLPAAGIGAEVTVGTLTPGGTANTINISSMPGIGAFPAQLPIIAYTTLAGAYNFNLGTLPGTYQGYLSNNTSSVDLVITNSLSKLDTWNGNLSGNWDTTTLNWRYSGNPASYQQGDNVTFDDSLTGTNNVTLTTTLLPGAIGVNNSLSNYTFSGSGKLSGTSVLTKQGTASLTLTETGGDDFSGGIVVNDGTLTLDSPNSAISGGLTVNAGTVQIGNNDTAGALPSGTITVNGAVVFRRTDAVTVATPIAGTGTLTQSGSGTLTLTGVNGYTGATTIGNGTLALSGSGTLSNSAAVNASSAAFDVSALSQSTTVGGLNLANATVTVAVSAGMPTNILASSLSFGGATNHLNVAALPAIASYPVTFTIIQSAGPASGSFNIGLGTVPAATPPYAASVSQSVDQMAVLLTVSAGPIGVRPSMLWVGADVPNLNTNWSDALNWQLPGAPTAADNVFFNNTAAQSASALTTPGGGSAALIPDNINNIVNGNFSIASLTYTNLDNTYHNTFIADNATLTITNNFSVGSLSLDFGAANGENVIIAGPKAKLAVNNPNGLVAVALTSAANGQHLATLDLSALATFQASVSRVSVGSLNSTTTRPSGILYLAETNSLTLSYTNAPGFTAQSDLRGLGVGDQSDATRASILYLGRSNVINVNTIGVGVGKQQAGMLFNPAYTDNSPVAVFRGSDGAGPVSWWTLGDCLGQTGASSAPSGTNDFNGGTISALVTTMYLGRSPQGNNTGNAASSGVFSFSAGSVSVGTLFAGYQPQAITDYGVGTMNVSSNAILGVGATLVVNGTLGLGLAAGGAGAASTSGTLNVTNGTVQAYAIVPGTNSLSAITLAGGRLIVTNVVGNSTGPLGTLNLTPLNTPDNSASTIALPARADSPGMTVTTLNIDGLDTTTNILNVESVGPVGATPVELPLIQYGAMNLVSGATFNVGLGSMPSGYAGYLTNDTSINAIALVLTSAIHPQPIVKTLSLGGSSLVISGTNGFANVPYYVVASTNVALPLDQWTRVATNVFGPNGQFSSTVSAALPQQFFQVQVAP